MLLPSFAKLNLTMRRRLGGFPFLHTDQRFPFIFSSPEFSDALNIDGTRKWISCRRMEEGKGSARPPRLRRVRKWRKGNVTSSREKQRNARKMKNRRRRKTKTKRGLEGRVGVEVAEGDDK